MGMATGQGPIPETEVNSGGGKRQNFEKSQCDKKFPKLCIPMYLMYETLASLPLYERT